MGHFFDKIGIEFETELIERISKVSRSEWGIGSFKFSTIKEDSFDGTDCTVLGVPIDVTLNYEGKKRMKRVRRAVEVNGITVSFGIRYGNRYHEFETPVLVIGIENAVEITRNNIGYTVESLRDSLKEILEIGMDEYFALV